MKEVKFMRSVTPMRTAKIGYIITSVALCILGGILIIFPEITLKAVGIVCGIVLFLFGIVRVVGYFSKDLYRLAFQFDLAFGIMMLTLGIILLLNPHSLMNFLCIALGLYFFADGLFKIQISLDSKSFGIKKWWLIMLMALITAVFGIVLILRPSQSVKILIRLVGISMLCEGFLNIVTVLCAVKIIKHQQPDIIDIEYFEERED